MKILLLAFLTIALACKSAPCDEEDIFQPMLPKNHHMQRRVIPLSLKIKEGDKIPDIEVKDLAGNKINIPIIRKDRIFIIRFIQHDIALALDQFNHLNDVAMANENTVTVLDIVTKDNTPNEKLIEQYENVRTVFYVVKDLDGKIADIFGVTRPPVLLVFDKDGRLRNSGSLVMPSHLQEIVDEILEKQQIE